MPKLGDDMQQHTIGGSHYGFSAAKISTLGASEYTIVDIECDASGSVRGFERQMEAAIKAIVESCRSSPRADNLLLRLGTFNHNLHEVHGFKPLIDCPPDAYANALSAGGGTALYDAAYTGVEAVTKYGEDLVAQKFEANGIIFVITDGCENGDSTQTMNGVKAALERATRSEKLESLVAILIGVNIQNPTTSDEIHRFKAISKKLQEFKDRAAFTQYVEVDKADAKTLAKLADFVSRSISAQSQSLGSGGPSKALTF